MFVHSAHLPSLHARQLGSNAALQARVRIVFLKSPKAKPAPYSTASSSRTCPLSMRLNMTTVLGNVPFGLRFALNLQ